MALGGRDADRFRSALSAFATWGDFASATAGKCPGADADGRYWNTTKFRNCLDEFCGTAGGN